MSKELEKIVNIQNKCKLSVVERINYLNKLKKEIIENEDNIYSALHDDLNKSKFEVYTSEIGYPFWYNDFKIGTANIGVPIKTILFAMIKELQRLILILIVFL